MRETFRPGRLIMFGITGLTMGAFQAAYQFWGRDESLPYSLGIGALFLVAAFFASMVGDLTRVWLDGRRRSDPWDY